MINKKSHEFRDLMEKFDGLRTAGDFKAASELIAARFSDMESDAFEVACRKAIHTARQGGLSEVARALAAELASVKPDDALVIEVLGKQGGLGEVASTRFAEISSINAEAEIEGRQGGLGEVAHIRTGEPKSRGVDDGKPGPSTEQVSKTAATP